MRSSTRASVAGVERARGFVGCGSELPGPSSTPRARHCRWRWPAREVEAALRAPPCRGRHAWRPAPRRGARMQRGAQRVVVEGQAEGEVLAHAGLEQLGLLRDQRGDAAQLASSRRAGRRARARRPAAHRAPRARAARSPLAATARAHQRHAFAAPVRAITACRPPRGRSSPAAVAAVGAGVLPRGAVPVERIDGRASAERPRHRCARRGHLLGRRGRRIALRRVPDRRGAAVVVCMRAKKLKLAAHRG